MILSPADDFSTRTLSALPGILSKLEYVAQLRSDSGAYLHWGLSRTYGQAAANETVASAHTELFLETLRTPLKKLAEEMRTQADERGMGAEDYIADLLEQGERLLPQSLLGGTRRHFNSVLHSLSALANAQARQRNQAA